VPDGAAHQQGEHLPGGAGGGGEGDHPQRHVPAARRRPGAAPAGLVGGQPVHERGAGGEEAAHRPPGEVHGVRQPAGVEPGQGGPGPGPAEAAHDDLVVVDPRQVHEPVGERRAELPAVGGRGARVRGGHEAYAARQPEGADAPLQHEAQQGRLDGGRRGRQLVEEEQAAALPDQAHGPVRRGHRHALDGRVVAGHGQSGEVGGLVHGRDEGGQREDPGGGQQGRGGGLADARFSQEQDGQVGGDGQGQGLQLGVGAGFGGGGVQEGQQVGGDVEAVGGGAVGRGAVGRGAVGRGTVGRGTGGRGTVGRGTGGRGTAGRGAVGGGTAGRGGTDGLGSEWTPGGGR